MKEFAYDRLKKLPGKSKQKRIVKLVLVDELFMLWSIKIPYKIKESFGNPYQTHFWIENAKFCLVKQCHIYSHSLMSNVCECVSVSANILKTNVVNKFYCLLIYSVRQNHTKTQAYIEVKWTKYFMAFK